jgi:hypothetical protein
MPRKMALDPGDRAPTQKGLARFIQTSTAGDRYIYHVGDLSSERLSDPFVRAIAAEACRLAEAGIVSLVQRRLAGAAFVYYVERRP